MTDSASPLTDAQRDNLIRTMTRTGKEKDAKIQAQRLTINELRAELVAAHTELALLKSGVYPEAPFS